MTPLLFMGHYGSLLLWLWRSIDYVYCSSYAFHHLHLFSLFGLLYEFVQIFLDRSSHFIESCHIRTISIYKSLLHWSSGIFNEGLDYLPLRNGQAGSGTHFTPPIGKGYLAFTLLHDFFA